MTTLYVASIAFVLFLIATVGFPFSGMVHIGPDAFDLVLQRIEILESARQ